MTVSLLFLDLACKPSLEKYEETRDLRDAYIKVTVYSDDDVLAQETIKAVF